MKTGLIKTSLKNFFKNLIFVTVPMGIIYLFLLIGIIIFTSAFFSGLAQAFSETANLIETSAVNSTVSVEEFVEYVINEINLDDTAALFAKVTDPKWFAGLLTGFFGLLSDSVEGFVEQFAAIAGEFISVVFINLMAVAVLVIFGVIFANFVLGFVIRRKTTKGSIPKSILAHTVVPLLQSAVLVTAFWLFSKIKLYGIALLVFVLLLMSGLSLSTAWLVHRNEHVKFKEIVTPVNILKQIGASSVLILLDIIFTVLIGFFDILTAILIAVPLLLYTLNIIDVNADSFVCALAKSRKEAGLTLSAHTVEQLPEDSQKPPAGDKNPQ